MPIDNNDNNFATIPDEIKTQIFSYLEFSDLNSAALVNKDFHHISNTAWLDKLKNEFNYQPKTVSHPQFFYHRLPETLARDRQIIITLQKLDFVEDFLRQIPAAQTSARLIHEDVNYVKLQADTATAYKNITNHLIQDVLHHLNQDERTQFQDGLNVSEKLGAALFDTLLTTPQNFSTVELQSLLRMLCCIDAPHLLTIILIKHQLNNIDLVDLFEKSLFSLNLNIMQNLISCGLDIQQNIDVLENDSKGCWLSLLVVNLEEILWRSLTDFFDSGRANSFQNMEDVPGVIKIKNIINFFLTSGIDPDRLTEITLGQDLNQQIISCRKLCEWYQEQLQLSQNPYVKTIGKPLLESIINYTPNKTLTPT